MAGLCFFFLLMTQTYFEQQAVSVYFEVKIHAGCQYLI